MSDNSMQIKVKSVRAYDKQCRGCEKYNREVMISVEPDDLPKDKYCIHDIFLTQQQAEILAVELNEAIKRNKKRGGK